MSHVSTMALNTTPLVMVVSSGLSSVSSVTVAPSLTGFPVSLDQHGVVPPPTLMAKGSGGVLGSVSLPQQQTLFDASSAYANYAMHSPQVGFFFRVEPPTILYIVCLVSILVSDFLPLGAELDAIFTYGGSTIRVCTFATLWSLPMVGICASW